MSFVPIDLKIPQVLQRKSTNDLVYTLKSFFINRKRAHFIRFQEGVRDNVTCQSRQNMKWSKYDPYL